MILRFNPLTCVKYHHISMQHHINVEVTSVKAI